MISGLSHTTIYTTDQERSLQFYTQVLGLEVRSDTTLDGFRWLTVGGAGQKDMAILLAYPAPPMFSEEDAMTIKALIAKGVLGGGVFNTDDCRASYEELKAKGVTFLQEPADRPYGVEAVFRDDSGNWFSLTQSKWLGG
jgi:catechol 2,3-dioxygenase-like lactoylglutathione lyase family enzyme